MAIESKAQIPSTTDFLEIIGYKGTPRVFYTIHQPGLPEESDAPEGLRCLRIGAVESIHGHPNLTQLNLFPGFDNRVSLDMIFVYDPNKVEVRIERSDTKQTSGGMTAYWNTRHTMEDAGWEILPAPFDRVVGYRLRLAE